MAASVTGITANELETKVLKAPGAVALDFYQASCPPCRALEPRLERIARQYKDRLPVYRVDTDHPGGSGRQGSGTAGRSHHRSGSYDGVRPRARVSYQKGP
jgi:thiol-disulfide isomerase/thioredoxin